MAEWTRSNRAAARSASAASDNATAWADVDRGSSDGEAGEPGVRTSGAALTDEFEMADVTDDTVEPADINVDGGDDLDRPLGAAGEAACQGTFDALSLQEPPYRTEYQQTSARPATAAQRKKATDGVQVPRVDLPSTSAAKRPASHGTREEQRDRSEWTTAMYTTNRLLSGAWIKLHSGIDRISSADPSPRLAETSQLPHPLAALLLHIKNSKKSCAGIVLYSFPLPSAQAQ